MNSLLNATGNTRSQAYWVVHPLDDHPEQKRDVSAVGPMAMSPSVRLSLLRTEGLSDPDDELGRLPLSRPCCRAQASGELNATVVSKPCPPF